MKKRYMKPSMKVYELPHRTQLLAGSNNDWDHGIGYIPGLGTDDMNKLA